MLGAIAIMTLRSFVPFLDPLNKTGIILTATILFFVFDILQLKDLQRLPWNIVLFFGGAMSLGFCLWETGAAQWLAVQSLVLFKNIPWLFFVLGLAFLVLAVSNLIMNVAAIAIALPVALFIAPYLGVAPEVVFFAPLVTAGMPFLLLTGAAPNAIAYESKQFSSAEFFATGILASIMAIGVLGLFVTAIWPLMGMPILTQ